MSKTQVISPTKWQELAMELWHKLRVLQGESAELKDEVQRLKGEACSCKGSPLVVCTKEQAL